MSETRRASRGSARSDDEALGSRRQPKMKYVYRLLRQGDIKEALASKTVYVLWPDDGTWYKGRVDECDVAAGTAVIFYAETEETEEADLRELIRDGQIAFKEPRPASHVCKAGEVELDGQYRGRQPGDPELEDSSGSEGEDEPDAGALEDSSDSDVSFASDELSGRKRKRRGEDEEGEEESDPEVHLEDFEKREIMRDMSDDEKPLGFRADQLERKHKRQAKRQATTAEGKPASGAGAPQRPAQRAAAEPARRRRREAAAGVAFAVQALAAVQAAAAADGSSSDEPPSARKQRNPRRQSSAASAGLDDEEEEAEAFTRQLLAKAAGKAVPLPGEKGRGAFYGAGRGLDRRQSSMGQSDEDVRDKVRAGLQQALELVAADEAAAKAEGGGGDEAQAQAGDATETAKPDPAAVAEAVEAALFTLHGGVTREYKQKFQSLRFNLKDPHNPDLRAHVLRGEIQPDVFVRMTATELASKELAEYRRKKEEEALKMSVLDAEAAAKFSTAAALDARDKLAIPASVMADKGMLAAREPTPELGGSGAPGAARGGEGSATAAPEGQQHGAPTMLGEHGSAQLGSGDLEGQGAGGTDAELAARAAGTAGDDEEYDPEMAFVEDEGSPGSKTPLAAASKPTTAALDWASIKAAAASAAAEQQQQSKLGGDGAVEPLGPLKLQEPLSGEAKGREGQHGRHESRHRHHHHKRDRTSASPRDLPSPHEGGTPASPAEPGSPQSLRHLLLPPVDSTCLFGKGVWEGQFVVPGTGAFQLSADGLAGSGDVAALLGDREIEVKGRLALQKLDHFLLELRHSRSRTVTLGLLSPADDCSPEERAAFQELVTQYTSRSRTGVAAPTRDIEAYLLPACPTADRLLAAARGAAPSQAESLLPAGLGPEQLLMAIIHRKDWFPPYGFVRPLKRPRMRPPAGAPPAAAPAAGVEPEAKSSAPVLPPPPAMPLSAAPALAPAAAGGEQAAGAAQSLVTLPAGLDLSALSALAASLGVVALPAAPDQPAAQPSGGSSAAQPDALQQLLSTLPPLMLATAQQASQESPASESAAAGGRPRRSRWEGGEGAGAASQAPSRQEDAPATEQKQRRSRWEGSEAGASSGEQAPSSMSRPESASLPPHSPPSGSLPQSQPQPQQPSQPQAQAAQHPQMGAMAPSGMQGRPPGPPPHAGMSVPPPGPPQPPVGMSMPPPGPPQPPVGMQPGPYPGGPPHSMPPPGMPLPPPPRQQHYGMGPPQPLQQQHPPYGQPQAGPGGFPPGPGGPMGPGPGMGGFPGGPPPPHQQPPHQQPHFPGAPGGGFPPPPAYMQQQPGPPPPQQQGYPGGPPGGPPAYGDGGRGRGPGGRGGWYGGRGRGGGRYDGGFPGRARGGRGRY